LEQLLVKNLFVVVLFIVFSGMLYATVYENADDKKNTKWKVLQSFEAGTVSNIYDKQKRSRVIKLKGAGTKSAYLLMKKKNLSKNLFWKNKKEKILHWQMKYSEDFVILIGLDTKGGKRFLIYTAGDETSYLQYGLRYNETLGKWKSYQRDLQKDLAYFEVDNIIVSVNSFVIKGSGFLDNIKLTQNKKNKNKNKTILLVENNKSKESNVSIKKIVTKKKKSHTPMIFINGENPMILKKGEKYVELGAVAKDQNNKELIVNISHAIDIFAEGEYSVLYMATDSMGNSVIDKRRVRVGEFLEQKESVTQQSESTPPLEEKEEELEKREVEMMAWEKELLLRETEIAQKEHQRAMLRQPLNQPLRPGL